MADGTLISISDGSPDDGQGSSFNISEDGGKTWVMNTLKDGPPGNHTNGVELNDGRIMTFSRDKGKTLGCLPKSISNDKGRTFTYHKSEFPGIGTVMRLALIRLEYSNPDLDPKGLGRKPILLVSIAPDGTTAKDANGKEAKVEGTYAAVSWDEGETWPVKRVMSNVKTGSKKYLAGPWNREITLDATHGQNKSYWAATQAPNGIIHLNDSRLNYAFNLAWLINGF
jgi:sulfatase modifying factor 1